MASCNRVKNIVLYPTARYYSEVSYPIVILSAAKEGSYPIVILSAAKDLFKQERIKNSMNKNIINKLCTDGEISLETEVSIKFRIKDSAFCPGTVRIHLPAPINASWLSEGRLIDSDPFFRMMSVEDYPQRSAYFNEILTENKTFSIGYGFTSVHKYIRPDISLIDSVPQKTFDPADIKRFMELSHCGCESYTALAPDVVTIRDVAPSEGLPFKDEYYVFLSANGITVSHPDASDPVTSDEAKKAADTTEKGTLARRLFDLIAENYTPKSDETLSMAFVAMCRMCGIPARWQGGYASGDITEEASGTAVDKTIVENVIEYPGIAHDWCMIHLLPYGWIYADPGYAREFGKETIIASEINAAETTTASEVNVTIATVTREFNATAKNDPNGSSSIHKDETKPPILLKDYFFGNIDPFMVPTATEPSANLYPAKDYERADKIFNVRGEAELIPGKMTGSGQFAGRGLTSDEIETTVRMRFL